MAEEKSGVPTHPIVESLIPEPGGERRVALVGYPGPSSTPDNVRLYTDLTFKTYLEFPAAAVVKAVPAKADDENSPTVVVVDPATKVDQVTTERTSTDAAFLSGAISSSHYGAAQSVGGAMPATIRCICVAGTVHHQTFLLGCTTVTAPPHTIAACPAAAVGMPAATMLLGCTTVTSPPSIPACPAAAGGMQAAAFPTLGCTIFGCFLPPTLNPQCHVTAPAGGGAGMAQANVGWPGCHHITQTAATLCTQAIGGHTPVCHNITNTAATTCTQPVAGAAAMNLGAPQALGCLNFMATTVCTPTGVNYLCPAG